MCREGKTRKLKANKTSRHLSFFVACYPTPTPTPIDHILMKALALALSLSTKEEAGIADRQCWDFDDMAEARAEYGPVFSKEGMAKL